MITSDYNELANNYELIERFGCVRKLDAVFSMPRYSSCTMFSLCLDFP